MKMNKKRDYFRILWTINGSILLILLLLISSYLIFEKINNISRNRLEGVGIIDETTTDKDKSGNDQIIERIEKYYGITENLAVIKIISSAITEKELYAASGFTGEYHSGGGSRGGVVNIKFINLDTGESSELFEHDLYLPGIWIAGLYYKNEITLTRNLYFAVEKDTNGNSRLDSEDEITLYTSERDGSKLKRILGGISTYSLIDENRVFLTFSNKDYRIMDYRDGTILFDSAD